MIQRERFRQLDKSGRAPPDRVILEVKQPKAIKKYYNGAGTIDMHNRIHANKLRLDHNLATRHWDQRFNFSIFGMVCNDAFLFYQAVAHANNKKTNCLEFFGVLTDKLIENQKGVWVT